MYMYNLLPFLPCALTFQHFHRNISHLTIRHCGLSQYYFTEESLSEYSFQLQILAREIIFLVPLHGCRPFKYIIYIVL